jgi:bifunctional UDP-N-acetylglucosamine pyrophosphorylase / glucosamine-1-phosphate N-acetyltransferase
MSNEPPLIVMLAAGKGVRMASATPKVLHAVAGRSMLAHVLATARSTAARLALIVAPGADAVRAEAQRIAPDVAIFEQPRPEGTGAAVLAAKPALMHHGGDVIVVFADVPLLEAATIARLRAALGEGGAVAVLAFEPQDPTGYGRLIVDEAGRVTAIREHGDADAAELSLRLCNAGAMAFRVGNLLGLLEAISNDNAKREFYLTDAVALAARRGLIVRAVRCAPEEALGVNTRAQLAAAEAAFQARARRRAMDQGATLIAPETVWFSFDTRIGRDVSIEPNVFFGPGVSIEDGVQILAHCHIVGARVRSGARVGPFARLRPGADIGPAVHVGNFVEVKNATLERAARANHLAYIGDGRVGEGANIGAGVIFCNYDGINKQFTDVGKDAFVGSNAALVAPVKIGADAYVASGSVITTDVAPGALALGRARQEQRPGWVARFRERIARQPKAGGK